MGLISLKEKNNSEGLFNLGIGEGLDNFNKITNLNDHSLIDKLNSLQIKNFFIFGEDPIGTAIDKAKVEHWFNQASFIVVQDYFMTETAQKANLILPASLPYETGGSFTNTQRTIQKIEKQKNPPFEYCNIGQLIVLAKNLGIHNFDSVDDVHEELNHLFANAKPMTFVFRSTEQDNQITLFKNGCDNINQQFMDYFDKKLTKKNKYEAVQ
jgi:predicted molibdopterin-dependent oxidoreductase YjgC